MKLTAIVRGRLYTYSTDQIREDAALRNIEIKHSVKANVYNGANGVFVSTNDGTSIVGHYIITEG